MGQVLRVYLSIEERIYLEDLISRESRSSSIAQRARILLLADRAGGTWTRYQKIAEILNSSTSTVSSVCRQYITDGLKTALSKRPQPGHVIKITEEIESHLALLVLSRPPEGQRYWTLKLLSEQLVELGLVGNISKVAIHKRLKKMDLNLKNLRPDTSSSDV